MPLVLSTEWICGGGVRSYAAPTALTTKHVLVGIEKSPILEFMKKRAPESECEVFNICCPASVGDSNVQTEQD